MAKDQEDLDNVDGHELVTVEEFAKRIGRSPYTVWGWIRNKEMPPGSVYRISREPYQIDLTRWEKVQEKARRLKRVI